MNSLWFRDEYREAIVRGVLDRTLRYGNRIKPNPKGYHIGEKVLVRFIKPPYNQIPPKLDEDEIMIKINGLYLKEFYEITENDLIRSDFQYLDLKLVRQELSILSRCKIDDKDLCTIVVFKKI